jgi:hypothetical protein
MSTARSLICLALSLSLQPLDARAQQATGTAAITGVVTDKTTSRPVGGAIVQLERYIPGQPVHRQVALTTPTGRFAFVELPAFDRYLLTSFKPGYLKGGYESSDPRDPGAPIALQDGQWMRDVRIAMPRPSSISGTVLDERGEPVVRAYVRVLAQITIGGRAQWLPSIAARTDDRGIYRIAGLGPGTYAVSVPSVQATLPTTATIRAPTASSGTSMADLREAGDAAKAERLAVDLGGGQRMVVGRHAIPPPPSPDGRRTAYATVFHPHAATPGDALPIRLGVGEDRLAVDFQLQPVRTARVSGTLQGPSDQIGNFLLRLLPVGLEELGQGSEAATTVTLSDGRFTFFDVPAGSYIIDARHSLAEISYTSLDGPQTALPAPVPFPARGASSWVLGAAQPGVEINTVDDGSEGGYWGQSRVEVAADEVENVVLTLRRPVALSGTVEWPAGARVDAVTIRLEPADGRRSLGMPMGSNRHPPTPTPNPGPFRIWGLMEGEYFLRVPTHNLQSITWEGQDYTDKPFDTRMGRDFTGIVVKMTHESSSIAGVVTDNGVAVASSAAVMAFPVERERWSNYGFSPPRLKSVLTTSDGRFRLERLPPGEYFLLSVPAAQQRAWLDPAFLANHAARATRVVIDRHGAVITNVNLTVVR